MDYPKRLIEVDLPIKRISAHARREKSIRHGHISTLHIWWARRPLAACRAVICAALWPDPADENCPPAFREEARRLMTDWAQNHLDLTSPESMSRFNRVKNDPKVLADNVELRKALLDFIADFANWDNSIDPHYISTSEALTLRAHRALGGAADTRPVVADPFAGGGAIPLEALRVGADSFASDLNPIPVLLNRVLLGLIPRFGQRLADEVRHWGAWVQRKAEQELAGFYPRDPDGSTPIAYLWARTIRCEGPGCGAAIPLVRSLLLAKRGGTSTSLKMIVDAKTKSVSFEVASSAPGPGTIRKGAATCPVCQYTTPNAKVRAQLTERRGGAADARLLAVVTSRNEESGRFYRSPTQADLAAAAAAATELQQRKEKTDGLSLVPDEPIPPERPSPNARGLSAVTRMGATTFGDLFTPRQALTISTFARLIGDVRSSIVEKTGDDDLAAAIQVVLAFGLDRLVDRNSTLCRWDPTPTASGIINTFSRQALPIMWDFAEGLPFEGKSGGWLPALEWTALVIEHEAGRRDGGASVEQASATAHPLPDDSVQALVTDPPYYDAIPYGDLSDFFYVWLRRSLPAFQSTLLKERATPKDEEAIWNPGRKHSITGKAKDTAFYEGQMAKALAEARRFTAPYGIGVVVFAHKSTAGWEAILSALLNAGWVATASWPVDTEMGSRMNAMGTASLASSVHIVCRPREDSSGEVRVDHVGDWRKILYDLPIRMRDWLPRLAEEGVVGADAIFACLGPALEIFSRYSRVEKASGEQVTLREYLEQVWAAISTEALSMIFRDADAAGLESDARFTAIVLWTLGAGGSSSSESSEGESEDGEEEDDEDDSPRGKAAKGGYTLEYDAARKIAQGLGVNLEQIDSVVEVKGDKARLRPVSERAAALFGKAEKAEAATKKRGRKAAQKKLFDKDADEGGSPADTVTIGEGAAATPGATALDRIHQAMLLFASGRADALKRFVVEDGVGGDARFWKLAQSLSALYPTGSDEKRWVDGVLARKKSFGF